VTTTGCDRCDRNGPELPTLDAEGLALHRALHEFGRAYIAGIRTHWRPLAVVFALVLLAAAIWGR